MSCEVHDASRELKKPQTGTVLFYLVAALAVCDFSQFTRFSAHPPTDGHGVCRFPALSPILAEVF